MLLILARMMAIQILREDPNGDQTNPDEVVEDEQLADEAGDAKNGVDWHPSDLVKDARSC